MAFSVYRNGSWKRLISAHVRVAGVWKRVLSIHAKDAGNWRSVWHDTFTMVIASNIDDGVNLRDRALAAGWSGYSKLNVIINSGVRISRNENDCFRVQGAFPGGVELWNYGQIVGKGGAGGRGGDAWADNQTHRATGPGAWGGSGMTALLALSPITVHNHGIIAGGGGGGGGGGGAARRVSNNGVLLCSGGGGGGGRSNNHWSPGGSRGNTFENSYVNFKYYMNGSDGGWGSPDNPAGGGGGNGREVNGPTAYSGAGGAGGQWGAGGNWGGSGHGSSSGIHPLVASGGGGPGGAGHAVWGNQYITWAVPGQRYGIIANAS